MSLRLHWLLFITLALLIIIMIVQIANISEGDAKFAQGYLVNLKVGNDSYMLLVYMHSPLYAVAGKHVSIPFKLKLVYATSNTSIFVTLTLKAKDITLTSYSIGYISLNKPEYSGSLDFIIPPQISLYYNNTVSPSFIILEVHAYKGVLSARSEIKIPTIFIEERPFFNIKAFFDNDLPYRIVMAGKDPYVLLHLLIINTGDTILNNINVNIYVNSSLLSSGTIAEHLAPSQSKRMDFLIPVPVKAGIYILTIQASGNNGFKKVSTVATALLIVLPDVHIDLVALNASSVEGSKSCFLVNTVNVPSYAKSIVLMEMNLNGKWNTVGLLTNTSIGTSSRIMCIKIPFLELHVPHAIEFRAILVLRIYGLSYNITSNIVDVLVQPVSSLLSISSLFINVNKIKFYPKENIKITVTSSPPLNLCTPVRVETYVSQSQTWNPVLVLKLCNGRASGTIAATHLGIGRHLLRGVMQVNGYTMISNPIEIVVLKEPSIGMKLIPNIVAPNMSTQLVVKIEPLIEKYRLAIWLPWSKLWLNTSGVSQSFILPISAPPRPGLYVIKAILTINGYSFEKELRLRVAKLKVKINVEPTSVRVGETKYLRVDVETYPELTNTSLVVQLIKLNKVLYSNKSSVINGHGMVLLRAPSSPGQYIVKAVIPQYGVSVERNITALQLIYGIELRLNTSRTSPASMVSAVITVTPVNKKPVTVLLLLRKKGETAWRTIASGIATNGSAVIVFRAPDEPGLYEVVASAPSLKQQSSIVELEILAAKAPRLKIQPHIVIGAVALAALLWSVRAIRRR